VICACPEVLGWLFIAVQVIAYAALGYAAWRAGKRR
jgi:hypothetical protein